MKIRNGGLGIKYLIITMILSHGISFSALAHEGEDHTATPAPKIPKPPSCQILTADRLFDGVDLHLDWAVLIKKEKIFAVGPQAQIKKSILPKDQIGRLDHYAGIYRITRAYNLPRRQKRHSAETWYNNCARYRRSNNGS